MSDLKSLIVPFLIGGTIIASVKYASVHVPNPALAAIIGGFPTGLLSIYFVSNAKAGDYARNYFFVTLILLAASAVFYMAFVHGKLSKHVAWIIAVAFWIIMVSVRYVIAGKKVKVKKN
jgi:hypothetical protein